MASSLIIKAKVNCPAEKVFWKNVPITRHRGRSKGKSTTQVLGKRSRSQELEVAEQEIRSLGMEEYCSVLGF